MKSFTKSLKRQDGFTLVELMVVVAIIGLLSAVAIPNFKKYQAKAKMSEAKLQLAAVYTAQTSFFSDYNLYANCLSYMGFDPTNETASRYYGIGFDTGGTANPIATSTQWVSAVNSGLNSATCVPAAAGGGAGSFFAAGKGVGTVVVATVADLETATTASVLGTQADSTTMTYTVTAAGVISGDAATLALSSAISMDQTKVMATIRNGF